MDILVVIGVVLTLCGLVGLGVVVRRAWRARAEGLTAEAMQERLKGLVPLNLAALALSALGLMCVILGLFLG